MGRKGKKKRSSGSSGHGPQTKKVKNDSVDSSDSSEDDLVFEDVTDTLASVLEEGSAPDTTETLKLQSKALLTTNNNMSNMFKLLNDIKTNQKKQQAENQKMNSNLTRLVKQQEKMLMEQKEEINELREDLENLKLSTCDQKTEEIQQINTRLEKLENTNITPFSPETSVVVYKVPYEPNENLQEKTKLIVEEGVEIKTVPVANVMRTPMRQGRPGIMKIQFNSLEDKLTILRNKGKLKEKAGWMKNVYMRSSKSHAERLLDLNFRAIADELGGYYVTGSGRLMKNDTPPQGDREHHPVPVPSNTSGPTNQNYMSSPVTQTSPTQNTPIQYTSPPGIYAQPRQTRPMPPASQQPTFTQSGVPVRSPIPQQNALPPPILSQ